MMTLIAPELDGKCVMTRTGLRIGCAYVRPPPRMSADEERLQRALLDPRTQPCNDWLPLYIAMKFNN